jgi:hypothetical protein
MGSRSCAVGSLAGIEILLSTLPPHSSRNFAYRVMAPVDDTRASPKALNGTLKFMGTAWAHQLLRYSSGGKLNHQIRPCGPFLFYLGSAPFSHNERRHSDHSVSGSLSLQSI